MNATERYFRYWGKAGDGDCHILAYHSLDVASVGQVLLDKHPTLRRRLSTLVGLTEGAFRQWAVYLLALHDIGKFAVSFQQLRPDLLQRLQQRCTDKPYSVRHDTLGYLVLSKHMKNVFRDMGIIPASPGGRQRAEEEKMLDVWMATVTGHHGMPPKDLEIVLTDHFEASDQAAIEAFLRAVSALLLPTGQRFPAISGAAMRQASWWLAGFAVLCDWIGSNSDYFPRRDDPGPLTDYIETAKQHAAAAIAATELLPARAADNFQLNQLICTAQPLVSTPLQHAASQIAFADSPRLFILEDTTGAGKTEAALLLAHRLMAQGLGEGIYFGLPTMATANAMYMRLGKAAYRRLYRSDSEPSLILAHGASNLSDDFRKSILPVRRQSGGDYDGEQEAAAHCGQWLSDNRKKALLADVGIGTLDQALLAILPSRHQSLRLLGLLNKILLIDEVHACDAYMHPLLCRLLRAHASAGGSAILLSATLPQQQRQDFADSFARGLGCASPNLTSNAYPLFTQVGERSQSEVAVSTRDAVRRSVKIQCLESEEAVVAEIAEALAAEECICWIRNTVTDSRESYAQLLKQHPDWQVDLFHARFALGDRLDIENRVLERFGKESRCEHRRGRLLIATQVVEQSLDLDFDRLITDLAPIDLIIQRAGRLRRHRRDQLGNPINGADQRGAAILTLHTPTWQEDPKADWFVGKFKRAGSVYPDHGQLWLGLKLLRESGVLRMPEDARSLIEGVYGPDAEIPTGLTGQSSEAQGGARAEHSIAMLNELKIELGYNDASTNRWWDDTQTPTRLGEPTSTVWLARWQDDRLTPWRADLPFAWQQSSVSIRSALVGEEAVQEEIPDVAVDDCRLELPAEGKWGVLLPLIQLPDGSWRGIAHDQRGRRTYFHYTAQQGLMTEKESRAVEGYSVEPYQ